MSLSIGIIGLPNVGKSSLFNALTRGHAPASNYPFCTVDKNVGIVEVADERLDRLNAALQPQECVRAAIQFIDIAGLVRGASKGEGLGNMFLGHIREVHAVAHVVRCFEDPDVPHVAGELDPLRDVEIVETELALADLETAAKAADTRGRHLKAHPKESRDQYEALCRVRDALDAGTPVRRMGLDRDHLKLIEEFHFLTAKPVLFVANVAEHDLAGAAEPVRALRERFGDDHVVCVSARLEAELADLEPDERQALMEEYGEHEPGVARLIAAGYRLLGYITFYTIAHNKLRAWEIVAGSRAEEAAAKIHTDMEAGFIRAEVAHYSDVLRHGSLKELRAHGLVRAEGRDHVVADGDVIEFHFKAPG